MHRRGVGVGKAICAKSLALPFPLAFAPCKTVLAIGEHAERHPSVTDVFISYKREERDAVTTMVERLRALKIDVWFDGQLRTYP